MNVTVEDLSPSWVTYVCVVVIVLHALHDVTPTPMAPIAMMIKIFFISFDFEFYFFFIKGKRGNIVLRLESKQSHIRLYASIQTYIRVLIFLMITTSSYCLKENLEENIGRKLFSQSELTRSLFNAGKFDQPVRCIAVFLEQRDVFGSSIGIMQVFSRYSASGND